MKPTISRTQLRNKIKEVLYLFENADLSMTEESKKFIHYGLILVLRDIDEARMKKPYIELVKNEIAM